VHLRVDGACDRVCNIAAPRTGLEAKFSLRLTTAMALAGVETGALASYSERNAADPALVALRTKVELDFQSGWPHTLAEIELELTDGSRGVARHDAGIPSADIADQGRRLSQKFSALVEPLRGARAGQIVEEVNRLDALDDMRGMLALCG
jgi:2-methylcitrate dehydratase PrpD